VDRASIRRRSTTAGSSQRSSDERASSGANASQRVPYGSFKRPLATVEWSPTEPQYEKKYYVAGIGEIAEKVTQGGHEQFKLVSVKSATR
jgi:hypothetical protein